MDTSFASSAYKQTFEELKWAGVDETVADKAALASGFAEAFFEHFSVENLIHMKAPKTATQFFRNLAMQGFTESSEELATSVANRVINDCLGEHSDFRQRVDYYMRTYHTTVSEAKRYAMQLPHGCPNHTGVRLDQRFCSRMPVFPLSFNTI